MPEERDRAKVAQLAHDDVKRDASAKTHMQTDKLSRIQTIFFMLVSVFSTIVGCMLSIFVPQACGMRGVVYDETHAPPFCGQSFYVQGDYVSQRYFTFVFTWNVITCVAVYYHHAVIWQREQVMLRRLEFDPATPIDRLPGLLPFYQKTSSLLYLAHRKALVATVIFMFIFCINVCVSIVLCYLRYAGTLTVTVFITNSLILCKVIYESFRALIPAVKHNLALSAFFVKPVFYNVLDLKYVDPRDPTRGARIEQEDIETGKSIAVQEFRHLPLPMGSNFQPEPFSQKKGDQTPLRFEVEEANRKAEAELEERADREAQAKIQAFQESGVVDVYTMRG